MASTMNRHEAFKCFPDRHEVRKAVVVVVLEELRGSGRGERCFQMG